MQFLQTKTCDQHLLVSLNRGKVNAIHAELIAELRTLVAEVNQNPDIRGVILTGQEHYFSAGIDVIEVFGYDAPAIRHFWTALIDLLIDMLSCVKPWIAAIGGHSPAGGCVLTLCCDYRVMAAGNYKIGLNEVPVGMVVPAGIQTLYAQTVGARLAYQYLLEGKLLLSEQALAVGLVDEVVAMDQVLPQATLKMAQYLSFNPVAWQLTKRNLRQALIRELQDKQALETTLTQWWSPETQDSLQALINQLKK